MDRRIAVLGPLDSAPRHALFLRTYSRDITLLNSQPGSALSDNDRSALRSAQIELVQAPMVAMNTAGNRIEVLASSGQSSTFDTLYPVLGCQPGSLAEMAGADYAAGSLAVDAHQQASVSGLYAAGDLVSGINQISVATGHAAVAATAIHNRLAPNYR